MADTSSKCTGRASGRGQKDMARMSSLRCSTKCAASRCSTSKGRASIRSEWQVADRLMRTCLETLLRAMHISSPADEAGCAQRGVNDTKRARMIGHTKFQHPAVRPNSGPHRRSRDSPVPEGDASRRLHLVSNRSCTRRCVLRGAAARPRSRAQRGAQTGRFHNGQHVSTPARAAG